MKRINRFSCLDELQYVIVPGKEVSERYISYYQKLYDFWKKQWLPIYKSIDSNFGNFSDMFTRQTEITGLFYKDEPIGFFCMDLFSVYLAAHRDHSYFKVYPQEIIEFLNLNKINKIIVDNQLTVRKDFRGGAVAELLIGLTIKRFQYTNCDYKLSYTRNSKKTHEMAYKWGWFPILKGQQAHGESADFIVAQRGDLDKYYQHPLCDQVEKLWKNRIHESGFLNERIYNESVNVKDGISTNVERRESNL